MNKRKDFVSEREKDIEKFTLFGDYRVLEKSFDELFHGMKKYPEIMKIKTLFDDIPFAQFLSLHQKACDILKKDGVTFRVYSENQITDHTFPFDLVPRVISSEEWVMIEKGLKQRVVALDLFLDDIYGAQKIIKDKRIPTQIIQSSVGFVSMLVGIKPCGGTRVHIAGIDLVRNNAGNYLVLEDNLRVPSGVSYAIEHRRLMKNLFKDIFDALNIIPVDSYPANLRKSILSVDEKSDLQHLVLLTPGPYNSAYYEHQYLAKHMPCSIVEGTDLVVENDRLYQRTSAGLKRVTALYRRIDDEYLDPEVFNRDSLLGVPGIFRAYAQGNLILANALGNGVADDKAVYKYVPDMIRYYLGEEPIIDQVPTYLCDLPKERQHVLDNLDKLVVKLVNKSGGYGMLIGPQSTRQQQEEMRQQVIANPRLYIAQPLVELSTSPTLDEQQEIFTPHRVDLRPFVLLGKEPWVMPGGLTRVALKPNSYVVNSSQGGGSKDTWVLSK